MCIDAMEAHDIESHQLNVYGISQLEVMRAAQSKLTGRGKFTWILQQMVRQN